MRSDNSSDTRHSAHSPYSTWSHPHSRWIYGMDGADRVSNRLDEHLLTKEAHDCPILVGADGGSLIDLRTYEMD